MRLWHYKLLPVLPNKFLVNQWRECNACAAIIAKDKLKRNPIIKRVGNYDISHFMAYCRIVEYEMAKRGFVHESKSLEKYFKYKSIYIEKYLVSSKYSKDDVPTGEFWYAGTWYTLFDGWMNDRYLNQCIMMLEEKYDCDMINKEDWQKISKLK